MQRLKRIARVVFEASEKPSKTTSEASDYTDYKRLQRFFSLRINHCNLNLIAVIKRASPIFKLFQSSLLFVFIFSSFIAHSFAAQAEFAEFKAIKELEAAEKSTTAPVEPILRPNVEYKAAGLRAPFQGPTTEYSKPRAQEEAPAKEPPPFVVQGLIWGGPLPQAIINNKVVKEGDTIEGVRIISIKKDGIIVFFEGRAYNLSSPARASGSFKETQGGQDEPR